MRTNTIHQMVVKKVVRAESEIKTIVINYKGNWEPL